MKFNCNIRELKGAMSMVKRGMNMRTSLPVFTAIKMVADQESNTVALVGTDSEVMIGAQVDAEVIDPGESGVGWNDLNNILPEKCDYEAEVLVSWEEGYIFTQQEDLRQRVVAADMTDFPMIPQVAVDQIIVFGDDIGQCFPFMSNEDDRLMINGVHVEADGKKLNVVATDGRILKCIRHPHKAKKAEQFAVTFNRRACAALKVKFRDLLKIGFSKDDSLVRVHGDKGELFYMAHLAQFPDYNAILGPALGYMQRSDVVEIEFDRHELLEKLERMCHKKAFTKRSMGMWFYMLLEDGMVKLKYRDTVLKVMADDTIQPRMSTGDAVLAVNPFYLNMALKGIKHESVTLYVNPGVMSKKALSERATLQPMLMVPTLMEGDTEDYTILMPMKVGVEKESDLDFKEEEDDGKTDPDHS